MPITRRYKSLIHEMVAFGRRVDEFFRLRRKQREIEGQAVKDLHRHISHQTRKFLILEKASGVLEDKYLHFLNIGLLNKNFIFPLYIKMYLTG